SATSGRSAASQPVGREREERTRRPRLRSAARAHDEDVALELEPLDAGLRKRPGGEIGLDRPSRDEGDAVACADRAQHRLLEAELEPDAEIAELPPPAAKLVLEQLAHARALLHRDQVRAAQLVERDRRPGEAVTRRADEDDGVAEERLERDAAVTPRGADDAELELACRHPLDDRLRVEHRQRHVQLRMPLRELAEELGDDDPAGPGRGADLERAGELLVALERDLRDDLLLERQQPLRAAVEAHPGLRRL